MYWWTVLEISEDSDLKTIKKAYAKLLKVHNPEDDAKGYQRIRTAYDEAVKYVKKNNKAQNNNEFINNSTENIIDKLDINEIIEDTSENYLDKEKLNKSKGHSYIDKISNEKNEKKYEVNEEKLNKSKVNSYIDNINNEKNKLNNETKEEKINKSKIDSYIDYINYESNQNKSEQNEQIKFKLRPQINNIYNEGQAENNNINEQIKMFFDRLNRIYNYMSLRIDASAWESLLSLDVIWNVSAFTIIEDELFDFLITHKYLPAEIWTKLNNNFTWSKNEIKLYKKYSAPLVDEVLKKLKEPNKLKYDFLMIINSEIADKYLYEREQAYEALEYGSYPKAYNHLKNANSLFNQDPELLRLMGNYNYEFREMNEALEFYKSALEINNYDFESALRCGIILVLAERFSEAKQYLEIYLSHKNNDKLALDYIAYCYYYSDNLPMAMENFKKLLLLDKNNRIAQKYIKNIEAKLEGKHVRNIKFDEEDLIKEEVVIKKVEIEDTQNYESQEYERRPVSARFMIRIAILVIFIINACFHGAEHLPSFNFDSSTKSYEDNGEYKLINSPWEFSESEKNTKIKIYFSSVKPIKYYKISETLNNRNIFSEDELDMKGLRDKVVSQLYIGSFKQHLYIFTDSDCNDKTINKDGGYDVKGVKCELDKKMQSNIQLKYISDYSNGYTWAVGLIDAS